MQLLFLVGVLVVLVQGEKKSGNEELRKDWGKSIADQQPGIIDDYFQPDDCGDEKAQAGDWLEIAANVTVAPSSTAGDPGMVMKILGRDLVRIDPDQLGQSLNGGPGLTEALTGFPTCKGARRRFEVGSPLSEKILQRLRSSGVLKGVTIHVDVVLRRHYRMESETTFKPKTCKKKFETFGDKVFAHVKLTLVNSTVKEEIGKVATNTREGNDEFKNQPLEFASGQDAVPFGMELGLYGMCVGEKRTVVMPDVLGMEHARQDSKGQDLYWKAELELMDAMPSDDVFGAIDTSGDKFLSKAEISSFFGGQVPPELEQRLAASDRDGDGRVSWDEFDGPKGNKKRPKVDYNAAKFKFTHKALPPMPISDEDFKNGENFQYGEGDGGDNLSEQGEGQKKIAAEAAADAGDDEL